MSHCEIKIILFKSYSFTFVTPETYRTSVGPRMALCTFWLLPLPQMLVAVAPFLHVQTNSGSSRVTVLFCFYIIGLLPIQLTQSLLRRQVLTVTCFYE